MDRRRRSLQLTTATAQPPLQGAHAAQLRNRYLSIRIVHFYFSVYFLLEVGVPFKILCILDSFIIQLGGLSWLILSYLAMATKSEGYLRSESTTPSDSVTSTTSIDSGYESLSFTPGTLPLLNREHILGLADLEYQASPWLE